MTRLLLIRHAPTPETGTRLTGRTPGVSLGPEGTAIAAELAERLADAKIGAIYASPVTRTWETALEIAGVTRTPPIPHEGLQEIDFGTWTGRQLSALRRLKAWSTVQRAPSRFRFPEGEAFAEAQGRAVAACEEIAAVNRKRTVAAVSHADVIKLVVAYYLGLPIDLMQRINVAPASVSVIDLERGHIPRVVAVNTSGDPGTWR